MDFKVTGYDAIVCEARQVTSSSGCVSRLAFYLQFDRSEDLGWLVGKEGAPVYIEYAGMKFEAIFGGLMRGRRLDVAVDDGGLAQKMGDLFRDGYIGDMQIGSVD